MVRYLMAKLKIKGNDLLIAVSHITNKVASYECCLNDRLVYLSLDDASPVSAHVSQYSDNMLVSRIAGNAVKNFNL